MKLVFGMKVTTENSYIVLDGGQDLPVDLVLDFENPWLSLRHFRWSQQLLSSCTLFGCALTASVFFCYSLNLRRVSGLAIKDSDFPPLIHVG